MIWGKGATTVGYQHPFDRVRCSECRRWARCPAEYELGRVLCERCQEAR